MNQTQLMPAASPAAAPLFLLSFRHRDELAAAAAEAGWSPVAQRRGAAAEQRFIASGANVAVVDARGALAEGIAAVRAIAESVQANAGALLVLLSRGDVAALDDFFRAGATHYLSSPFGNREFAQALRFAARLPERLAGTPPPRAREEMPGDDEMPLRGRDPLTGLRDDAEARAWLAHLLKREEDGGCTALLVNVNRFDLVNTVYGRAIGDSLLRSAARRIERVARELGGRNPLIARMAGAEFLVGVRGELPPGRARFLAERIIEALQRPFLSGDQLITLGARVGVAQAGPCGDPTALLRSASVALASAKMSESAIRVSGAPETEAERDSRLELDLRRAIAEDEIEILFQPQLSVTTDELVGVEALARWRHPDYGELGASTLFAVADAADHLIQLSEHVQARSLALAAAWPQSLREVRLSVNITAADIAQPSFAERFLSLADTTGFPRGRLTVEITENGLIDDLSAAASLLAELRAGGCRVAIDDFGTGYSSLAYLKALPLDYLKIDQRLSRDIAGSTRDRVVVRSVIDMARSLGLGVIAEGVESEEQLALLAQEGCTIYQGFLRAGPLDTAGLEAFAEGVSA